MTLWHYANFDLPRTTKVFCSEDDPVPVDLSEPVLIWDGSQMAIARWEADPDTRFRGWIDEMGNVYDGVTHWTELPKAPKGE